MKQNRRWMKSAIEASKQEVRLPWERKARHKAPKRPKSSRRAA